MLVENHQADAPPGLASLVGSILHDGQKLVRQEAALARREVAQAWDKAKTGVELLASALTVGGVAGVLLGLMLVKLLQQNIVLPNHEWACFGITGSLLALVGGALSYCGLKQIKRVHLTLAQTVDTLREDARALSDAVSEGRSSTHALLKRQGEFS